MQVFPPYADTLMRGITAALMATVLLFLIVMAHTCQPTAVLADDQVVEQPVPFSHQHHVGGLGLDCRYCHASVEESDFAGMPSTHTCMTCHSQVWTEAEMLAPVRESYATDTPLRWTRVHDLPDFVFFSHQAHVAKGVSCQSCHGRVDRMPLVHLEHAMSMEWCLDCHRVADEVDWSAYDVYAMAPGNAFEPPRHELLRGEDVGRVDWLTNCSTCHR